jgi:hypothetical protein
LRHGANALYFQLITVSRITAVKLFPPFYKLSSSVHGFTSCRFARSRATDVVDWHLGLTCEFVVRYRVPPHQPRKHNRRHSVKIT